jgi:hypothetical protein
MYACHGYRILSCGILLARKEDPAEAPHVAKDGAETWGSMVGCKLEELWSPTKELEEMHIINIA